MKKIVYLLLVMILALGAAAFAACDQGGDGTSADGYYTVSDFETEDELFAMNWKNSFGIVESNTDPQYVRSGSASARLEVHGDPLSGAGYTPYGIIYTNDGKYNFRKTDYTDVEAFEFSIYNASDRDTTVKFQFLSSAIYKGGLSSEEVITLKKGEWTDAKVEIDRGLLSAFMDLSAISEFYFKFENRTEEQEPLVLYLDRFVAKTTKDPIPQATNIRKENEIESADRAEYLGAWSVTPNRGATLSWNTDPEFIREGSGSFHFSAQPTGGENWPEIVLKSNMITDISDYASLYFWMYNDNDEAYQIVTAGGWPLATLEPHAWTLVDMTVNWIAGVPNFTHDDVAYDIENFNNFTISLTNPNRALSFYFDGFYARYENEGYIGEDEPGEPIELSQSGVITTTSGQEFSVPTVTNASDYSSVTWTISQTLEAGVYEYAVNDAWTNAATFTPGVLNAGTDSETVVSAAYLIEYTATDAQGRISRASVNVIAENNVDAFDMSYGTTDGLDTVTPTKMSGNYGTVQAELNTDKQYTLFGENSIKVTFPQVSTERQFAFTWTPGFNVNAYDWINFAFYNANSFEYTLVTMWGAQIVLAPGAWVIRTVPVAQFNSWVGAAPEVHSGEEFSMSFATPMIAGMDEAEIYMEISTSGYHDVDPVITLPKTTDVVAKGSTVTVPVPTNSGVTWQVFCNDVLVPGSDNAATFEASEYGVYKVTYTRVVEEPSGNKTGTRDLLVYVLDPAKIENPNDEFTDDAVRLDPTVEVDADGFLGSYPAIHVTGTKEGSDIGFAWHTGVYNDLNSVTFYVYNNSDGNIILSTGWGSPNTIAPQNWAAITLLEATLNQNATGWKDDCSVSQVGRVNGEWLFAFPTNVASTAAYDITIVVVMDKGDLPEPTFELQKSSDAAAVGSAYAVPEEADAAWEVWFNEEKLTEGVTEEGFTPSAAGTYEVRYTKEVYGQPATATMYVYAVDVDAIENPNEEFTDDALRLDPTVEVDADGFLGSYPAIHVTGTKEGTDIGFVWHTGVYNDLNSVTFYAYNNSDGNITLVVGDGLPINIAPQSWAATTLVESTLNQNAMNWQENCGGSQVGRVNGEWLFAFPTNVASTTAYDITIVVVMDKGEVPEPTFELQKSSDITETGSAYTVPEEADATWEVWFNGAKLTDGVTEEGFTPSAAGTYEVRYAKEMYGQPATATMYVYAVDASKVEEPNEEFGDDPNAGRQESATAVDDTMTFLGTNMLHVSGTRTLPDMGFVWKSGVFNDLNSLTIYVYNNSDGAISYNYGSGASMRIQPKSWGVSETLNATQIAQCAAGWKDNCSAMNLFGRENGTGQWVFNITANIASTTNYEFFVAFVMEKGEVPEPTFTLQKSSDAVALSSGAYAVPEEADATWEVWFNEAKLTDGVTAEGFTPSAAGTYEVRYTKELYGQIATATMYVYVVDTDALEVPNNSFEADPYEHPVFDTMEVVETDTLASAIHLSGNLTSVWDAGCTWKTGVTDDLDSITFYIYNGSDASVNFVYGYGASVQVDAGAWAAVTIAGSTLTDNANGYGIGSQVGRVENEWLFVLQFQTISTTVQDIYISVAMDRA